MHSALTANYKAYLLKRREMCLNRQTISNVAELVSYGYCKEPVAALERKRGVE